jgi:hypothetical protein
MSGVVVLSVFGLEIGAHAELKPRSFDGFGNPNLLEVPTAYGKVIVEHDGSEPSHYSFWIFHMSDHLCMFQRTDF